jgi:hypothetical protein
MATRSLNEFISKIKTESAARTNRFSVLISNTGSSAYDTDLVQLYCEQASLPSITFASQPVRTYGEQREVVYDRNFETLTLNFIVDRQYKIKEFFDQWGKQIVDPITRLSGYYNDYTKSIIITTQDTQDNNTYECEIFEAYPKSIASIGLDHNSKDIVRLQVTFNYKYHINRIILSSDGNSSEANKVFPLTIADPYSSIQAGSYLRDVVSNSMAIPDLYYENFQKYQENLNDKIAISRIESSNIITGLGIPSNLTNYFG